MTTMIAIGSGTWTIHSARAEFHARGFVGQAVIGTIAVVAGTIDVDGDHQPRRLQATLDPASINTGHKRRDKDLRAKRFLNVAAHPAMSIDSGHIAVTPGGWFCRATLHVAGADAPLLIRAELDGTPTDTSLHVRGTARLDLRDAGITVPALLVRRYVDLTVSAELMRLR